MYLIRVLTFMQLACAVLAANVPDWSPNVFLAVFAAWVLIHAFVWATERSPGARRDFRLAFRVQADFLSAISAVLVWRSLGESPGALVCTASALAFSILSGHVWGTFVRKFPERSKKVFPIPAVLYLACGALAGWTLAGHFPGHAGESSFSAFLYAISLYVSFLSHATK